jgi:hypothetical protein
MSVSETGPARLELALDGTGLPVSSLSSILRVLQATLREVARNTDETRERFASQPQPVLQLSISAAGGDMVMEFHFADPSDSEAMARLSERAFAEFVDRLGQFIKRLPQRGLWGESLAGSQTRSYESELDRRLDELRMELRRLPRAKLTFDRQTISIEGDRVEMS